MVTFTNIPDVSGEVGTGLIVETSKDIRIEIPGQSEFILYAGRCFMAMLAPNDSLTAWSEEGKEAPLYCSMLEERLSIPLTETSRDWLSHYYDVLHLNDIPVTRPEKIVQLKFS